MATEPREGPWRPNSSYDWLLQSRQQQRLGKTYTLSSRSASAARRCSEAYRQREGVGVGDTSCAYLHLLLIYV